MALAGCARTWDADAWARTRPELLGRSVGRLGDATPYLIAADDTLVLFLCRWPLEEPIGVSLPRSASVEERAWLRGALAAWEAALPGLRFAETSGDAPLRVRIRGDRGEGARTTAECAVTPPVPGQGPLDARIVAARVELRRAERDAWGRPVALSGPELVGSAAHELGHALGLQGHARRGGSVLVADVDAVRRIGGRLERGEALNEPAMRALYAVPSGTVLERRALPDGATAAVDALAARALARGSAGARLRVGDRGALLRWGPDPDLVYYLRNPLEIATGSADFASSLELPDAPAR